MAERVGSSDDHRDTVYGMDGMDGVVAVTAQTKELESGRPKAGSGGYRLSIESLL